MSLRLKKIDIHVWEFAFFIFLNFFMRVQAYYGKTGYQKITLVFTFTITVFGFFCYFIKNNFTIKLKKIETYLLIFWLFTVFSTIYNFKNGTQNIIEVITNTSFYMAIFLLSNILMSKKFHLQVLSNMFFIIELIFASMFIIYKIAGVRISSGAVNSVYFIVLLLPLILLNNKKYIRNMGIAIIIICAIISNKRTAFLMVIVSLAVYVIMFLCSKKLSFRKKIAMVIAVIIICGVIVLLYDSNVGVINITLFDRLATIAEDGGSGRDIIYRYVIDRIKNFNVREWIIGNGYNGVFLESGLGTSAHNDFLEVLFDYGIVGLMLYVRFIVKIVLKTCHMFKKNYTVAAASFVGIMMFFFMSSFSHLIIYPTYIAYLLVIWSVVSNENNAY